MTTMNLLHRSQQVAAFIRGEQRWPHPRELGGQFVQELRGLTVGIIGVRTAFHFILANLCMY